MDLKARTINSPVSVRTEELAGLNYQSVLPSPALLPWIDHYWQIDRQASQPQQRFRLHPDGGTSLVFNLLGSTNPLVELLISNERQSSVRNFNGATHAFGVRLRPGGCFALLGERAEDLLARDGWQDAIFEPVLAQLATVENGPEGFALLDDFFYRQASQRQVTPGLIQHWLNALSLQQSPAEVLADSGIHRRRLERGFARQVGISPGQLQQLLRIKLARCLLRDRTDLSVAEIGQLCGYYDQPHFNHHFRRRLAESPQQYRQRKMSQIYKSGNR